MKFFLAFLVIVAIAIFCLVDFSAIGSAPSGEYLKKISVSKNYVDGEFVNLEPTPIRTVQHSSAFISFFKYIFRDKDYLAPNNVINIRNHDFKNLPAQDLLIWLGHSSFYLQLNGKKILIDPVFSEYGSPIKFVNSAFEGTTIFSLEDFPAIDYVLISHDHYDHLEADTVKKLAHTNTKFICPLGVGYYLSSWGIKTDNILEGDWNTSFVLDTLTINILPARHYSGRGLKKNQTLWSSFLIDTGTTKIYYTGDTGYGKHFAQIGNTFNNIDYVIGDVGQYNYRWTFIHMIPERASSVLNDLKAKFFIPCHIGKFALSDHSFVEPFERLENIAKAECLNIIVPYYGKIVYLDKKSPFNMPWWRNYIKLVNTDRDKH